MNDTNTEVFDPPKAITQANPFAERANAQQSGALAVQEAPKASLAPIPITADGIQLNSIEAVWRIANLLYNSRLAPSSLRTKEQIAVALLRAIELKLPPLQAIEGMTVINNKVGLMGDLALSMVESSGLLADKKIRYTGKDETLCCTVTVQRKGREAQSYSFSVAEAKAAGIYQRSEPWRTYPKRMTYYRALGFALRDEFSDVLKGIKTVEELMDYPEQAKPIQINEIEERNNL
jgi:hypothetical protein